MPARPWEAVTGVSLLSVSCSEIGASVSVPPELHLELSLALRPAGWAGTFRSLRFSVVSQQLPLGLESPQLCQCGSRISSERHPSLSFPGPGRLHLAKRLGGHRREKAPFSVSWPLLPLSGRGDPGSVRPGRGPSLSLRQGLGAKSETFFFFFLKTNYMYIEEFDYH